MTRLLRPRLHRSPQPATDATITAKLDGVVVESFSTRFSLTGNSQHWYGFTDTEIDEIEILYTDQRLRIDNIQLGPIATPFLINGGGETS